jgi:cyanophycin synthetase
VRIERIRTLAGPNVYSHAPMLVMTLALDDLADRESHHVRGFTDRLLALLPGIDQHHCSRGYPGGFVERLREGTYFGHVTEHVALELTEHAGIPVFHGKTRETSTPGTYYVAIEYLVEHPTEYLLRAAVDLVESLVEGRPYALQPVIDEARRLVAEMALGPSTQAIVDAAERRGIPWRRLNDASLVQLGTGRYRKLVQAAMTSQSSAIAVELVSDKQLTKNLLEAAAISVPRGRAVRSADEAVDALHAIGPPVVVKPLDGRQGKGVTLGLTREADVRQAFDLAREHSRTVLVEQFLPGRNYRVLVVDGRVVAASERRPASVVGDGLHTVAALIDEANRDPRRGDGHEKPLTRIRIDSIVLDNLAAAGLSVDAVPERGREIVLRDSANLSTGGTAADVTPLVHPDVVELCERAARTVGLDVCGIDLVLDDIGRPLERQRGAVIELNAAPGLRMHHHPSSGDPRDAGGAIVEMLFPRGTPCSIPLVAITGTNGKTTTTRMIGHVLAQQGHRVGMTTTDEITIAGKSVARGDMTGPWSAHIVLGDPTVDVAVLETARGGIVRRGLGWRWADVGVITNIHADHIGQDGIGSLDDIAYIKALVAERVREGGTLVLNAEDERLAAIASRRAVARVDKRLVYVALDGTHSVIRHHREQNGRVFFVEHGTIIAATGARQRRLVDVGAIPATLGGLAGFNIANALTAIAALEGLGVPAERAAALLSTFESHTHNAGRANLFRVRESLVMVDYGHNADAFAAIGQAAAGLTRGRLVGVIGLPGDRADALIESAGRAAARVFDTLVIKEDGDRRGREPGVVARLLCDAVRANAPDVECHVLLDESQAITFALDLLGAGDLAVIFYDEPGVVSDVLRRTGAVPADSPGKELPAAA